MTWYQVNMSDVHMIDHIISRAYNKTNDCMFAYADRHNNFVYTSLKHEIVKPVKFKAEFDPDDAVAEITLVPLQPDT